MATRWGICGAGKISNDFCLCLKSLPSSEHQIVAVAAKDKDRAQSFAENFEIPHSYGSYYELSKDPDVEIVYVGTLNTQHVEQCLMFINEGKHVLCEKPMALSLEGCQKVLNAAKEKGVFFMEAFWSRHFPAYKFIKEHVNSGAIGDVVLLQATFTVPISNVPRVYDLDMGGGGLMDIGCYTVLAANLIFKGKPESIIARGTKAESGADKTSVIYLQYPGGKIASLAYSTEASGGANSLRIYGSKSNIVIPDMFWCPTTVALKDNAVKYFELPDVKNSCDMNFSNSQGLTYQAKDARECILQGLTESRVVPHEDSETIMYILQEVQKQLGVKYNYP